MKNLNVCLDKIRASWMSRVQAVARTQKSVIVYRVS